MYESFINILASDIKFSFYLIMKQWYLESPLKTLNYVVKWFYFYHEKVVIIQILFS